jgi:hypothetical protein
MIQQPGVLQNFAKGDFSARQHVDLSQTQNINTQKLINHSGYQNHTIMPEAVQERFNVGYNKRMPASTKHAENGHSDSN